MPERRSLRFFRFDEIMPEVDRLIAGGHRTVGEWSLGRICNHLASAIQWSVEGSPVLLPWPIRFWLGPVAKRWTFKHERLPFRIKLPAKMVPKENVDDRAEAEALRATIAYYLAHPSKRAIHPIFGRLSHEEWDRLHLLHSAHHLGFVLPGA